MYTFHEELPAGSRYNELRELVGWGALDPDAVARALPRSVFGVTARFKGEVIAFARVIGDGELCFYIQEVVVHPDHQKQGIATTFMEYIIEFLKKNAHKRSYIGVFTGKGLEGFYRRYGFWERPNDVMGAGMMQFWDDPDMNRRYGACA
jgi:GNAT superfamily N-acetyltransferase